MAIFRNIHISFWTDPKVIEEMTPEDKFFFLYILTNPNTTQAGIYQITRKQMAFEMGYSIESINSLIERFEKHHKLIKYNFETREIAIKNWGKYNLNKGGKPIEDCIRAELSKIKDKELIIYVANSISNIKIKKIFLEYAEHFQKTNDVTCNDTSTIRGKNSEKDLNENTENEEVSKNQGFNDTLDDTLTIRGQEKEEAEEEEKEEAKKETKEEAEAVSKKKNTDATFRDVIHVFENNIHPITPMEFEKLQNWSKDVECRVIIIAIAEAVNYGARNMKYINGILNNWYTKGLKTVEGVKAYQREWEDKKRAAPKGNSCKNSFCDYEQRSYDFDDLEKQLLGWKVPEENRVRE